MSLNTEQGMDEAQQRKHALNGHRMKNALFSGKNYDIVFSNFSGNFLIFTKISTQMFSFMRNQGKIAAPTTFAC